MHLYIVVINDARYPKGSDLAELKQNLISGNKRISGA